MALKRPVDQRDLQGSVLCGYGNEFAHALYLFLRVDDGVAARALLADLAEEVTNAVPWDGLRPESTLNLALSSEGLRAVGVREGLIDAFPDEFREGMAARAGLLGDSGPSAPEGWDVGSRGEAHLLLTVNARSAAALDAARDDLTPRMGGLTEVHKLRAGLLDHPGSRHFAREHFGFADGLSQPTIADDRAGPWERQGRGTPRGEKWDPLAPGEFVLGYPDEDGLIAGEATGELGRNGSFTVVRKLHQDVAAFTSYLRDQSGGDLDREELLAAKIVGRWRDGSPLVLTPDEPDPQLAAGESVNAFRYDADPDGHACPLGAHIRRSNPRDALGFEGALTKRHRIIRRGMPYGPRPADPAVPDREERGLMFVCHQASIERQFEFIQTRWLIDGDAFDLGDERDCLVASEGPGNKMVIHGSPPRILPPSPAFVVTKGGGYFFTPGITALRSLGEGA